MTPPHTPLCSQANFHLTMTPCDTSTSQYEYNGGVYCRGADDWIYRQCPTCSSWIGLRPKGSEYSFKLHVGSSACTKAKNAQESPHMCATSKHAGNTHVVGAPSSSSVMSPSNSSPLQQLVHPVYPLSIGSPFDEKRRDSQTHVASSLVHTSPSNTHSPLHNTCPFPSTSLWSALSSPQLSSAPLPHYNHKLILPSLALESATFLPLIQTQTTLMKQDCRGSLVLWESGDPATTYPYNLHSTSMDGTTRLPWQATVGERPNSLRLRSDECQGTCVPSQPCCGPCSKIQSSIKYRKIVDCARTDHAHRAYSKLSWEQVVERSREKADQLVKERTKV